MISPLHVPLIGTINAIQQAIWVATGACTVANFASNSFDSEATIRICLRGTERYTPLNKMRSPTAREERCRGLLAPKPISHELLPGKGCHRPCDL